MGSLDAYVRSDNAKRIAPNFPDLSDADDFPKAVGFLADNFNQFSTDFVSVFQSGHSFYEWIIRLGVYVGDLVIHHSINEASWTVGEQGYLVVRFSRDAGPFDFDPFTFVEERYFFGEPEDFYLALDIFKKLKC